MHTLFAILAWAMLAAGEDEYLSPLPNEFATAPASWAAVFYTNPSVAVISGTFNRTISQAPWTGRTSNSAVQQANQVLNGTDFIAYDPKFFDLIGPNATIERVQELPFQVHEASCFNPETRQLFFSEWGPPGGINGSHSWQYLLDTDTNTLRNITTNPPTWNAHGCVFYKGAYHVVTDGGPNNTGLLTKIDPGTLTSTPLLNNYYQQPFIGLNDIDIDEDGNYWITDDRYGWGFGVISHYPQTSPGAYFVDGKTMRPRAITRTSGEANGIAVTAKQPDGSRTVYIADTGTSPPKLNAPFDNFNRRELSAYDARGPFLTNPRLFNNPIYFSHDGVRVSRNGYVFSGIGQGVDVMDPVTGLTLGAIHVGGGQTTAVNLAFGEHELWIVGGGGVWHVNGVKERLARDWHQLLAGMSKLSGLDSPQYSANQIMPTSVYEAPEVDRAMNAPEVYRVQHDDQAPEVLHQVFGSANDQTVVRSSTSGGSGDWHYRRFDTCWWLGRRTSRWSAVKEPQWRIFYCYYSKCFGDPFSKSNKHFGDLISEFSKHNKHNKHFVRVPEPDQ
ncbi:hypothetical protein N0V93_003579 [Gnomoniopsis smithogilvyi]|uniref:SMP-30/Gluconolactonase/LRE-like region domain-containing protein n=1 Tax=Gnomoniopsis smithogilvyi TaxID=1191159 RepID=A0A9W9CZZ4_9PEZI|nr:hypothetical protein N0V93_003579 [Gnomoniopsis smithogilvyi]